MKFTIFIYYLLNFMFLVPLFLEFKYPLYALYWELQLFNIIREPYKASDNQFSVFTGDRARHVNA